MVTGEGRKEPIELLLDIHRTIMIEIYTMDPTTVLETNEKNERNQGKNTIF